MVENVSMSILQNQHENEYIIYDTDIFKDFDDISFSVKNWASRSSIIGFAEGRGTTFFVEHQGQELVLRHYKRGGKIAEYIEDKYLWTGLNHTRAWREFNLLSYMHQCALPVPKPVAAQVNKQGFFYTADLITLRIRHAHMLLNELLNNTLEQGHWVSLGAMVKRFHDKGIHHVDLNVKNILLDDGGRFYLIDFDKCRKRRVAKFWQQGSINRLKRSLDKALVQNPAIEFNPQCWQWFLQGYAG